MCCSLRKIHHSFSLMQLPPCFLLISASSSRISSVPSPHPSSDETPTTHKASEPASLKQAPTPSQSFFVASTPHNSRISGRSVWRRGNRIPTHTSPSALSAATPVQYSVCHCSEPTSLDLELAVFYAEPALDKYCL